MGARYSPSSNCLGDDISGSAHAEPMVSRQALEAKKRAVALQRDGRRDFGGRSRWAKRHDRDLGLKQANADGFLGCAERVG